MEQVLVWTGGQPFLTQKVCALAAAAAIALGREAEAVAAIVRQRVISDWERQDDLEHLRTIRDRVISDERRVGRLLGVYQQVLCGEVAADLAEREEQMALRLSGLVVKRGGRLEPYNPIYRAVFDEAWARAELGKLRPYAKKLAAWEASDRRDESKLLWGQDLVEAEVWAADKRLPDADYRFFHGEQRG